MSGSFQLGGDPSQIRASARHWAAFADAAASASAGIRSLDTSEFVGDEADTYQHRVSSDLPGQLDIAGTAWTVVSTALTTYAADLERHQQAMSALANRAGHQQATVDSCRTALDHAQWADRTHQLAIIQTREALEPGGTMPHDSYVSSTAGSRRRLDDASAALQATYDAASTVRSENAESVRRCRTEIDRAKHMRFAKPPGFWGRLQGSVCGWISDHADVLGEISGVLKTISAVAGLLSVIPVLAPVMAPIALATGAAALVIDVVVKLATGEGSWLSIGVDAATMLIPGVGRVVGKALRGAAPNAVRAMDRFGTGGLDLARNSRAGKALTSFADTRAGDLMLNAPGRALNGVNDAVARGIAGLPGGEKLANLAARKAEGAYVGLRTRPVSASRQQAMRDYMDDLRHGGFTRQARQSSRNGWAEYQVDKVGPTEYDLAQSIAAHGKGAHWADGLDAKTAAIADAKHASDAKYTYYGNDTPLAGSNPARYDSTRAHVVRQMDRYGSHLADPSSPMDKIIYHVNQESMAGYFLDCADEAGLGGKVVVVVDP